jgi:hypothetical protein
MEAVRRLGIIKKEPVEIIDIEESDSEMRD